MKSFRFALIIFAVLFFTSLKYRPLLRPDEFRYAEIPREMLASGNWISPQLVGMRYFEKPSLGYQITAYSFKNFGETAFALRLPQALAMMITAAFLIFFLKRLWKDEEWPPWFSAGFLVTFCLFYAVGTFAVLDMLLTMFLTLCIGCCYLGITEEKMKSRIAFLAEAGAAAGGAFLTKGFLAVVLPAIIFIPYLIWQKSWKKMFFAPWIPFAVMLAVILPWAIMIHQQEPDFWRYFFVEEHLKRFLSRTYDRKPQPFWYFIPVLILGTFPSILLLFAGFRGWTRKLWEDQGFRFLLLWAAVPFLFFSISSCKLPTYILPCFPPLAAISGMLLARAWKEHKTETESALRSIVKYAAIIMVILGIIGLAAMGSLPDKYPILEANHFPLRAGTLFFVTTLFGLISFFNRKKELPEILAMLLIIIAVLAQFAQASLPEKAIGSKAAGYAIMQCLYKHPITKYDRLLADKSSIVPVSWILKRNDITIVGKPGELKYAITNYPEYDARHIKKESELTRLPPGNNIYFVIRDLRKKPLPPNLKVLHHVSSGNLHMIRF